MNQNNMDVIPFEQLSSIFLQLRNSNKINDYQLNALQEYYRQHPVYNNVEDLKKFTNDISKIAYAATNENSIVSKNDDIEVIDFDESSYYQSKNDFNNISLNANTNYNNVNSISQNVGNQIDNTQSYSNENYVQKELFMLKGEYPNSIISLTDTPHCYILSQDGNDEQVKVEGSNGIYRIVRIESKNNDVGGQSENGISLTKSTLIGRVMASKDDSQAAFTNILFFIFLSGLSVGVVFMVILNFFVK